MKFLLYLVLFLSVIKNAFSQTGPGGVGNSSSTLLWLKSDTKAYNDAGNTLASNGEAVRQWGSMESSYNATQTTTSLRPIYYSNVINGMPSLYFDGNNDWMGITINTPETNFSQFVIFQTQSNDGDGCFLTVTSPTSPSAGDHDRQFGLTGNKLSHRLWSEQTIGSTSNFNNNTVNIANVVVSSTSGQSIYNNGTLVASGNKTSSNFNWDQGLTIGGHNWWGYIKAYIPEIIYYNFVLNSAQNVIVLNYLSAKYNATISANDIYLHDNVANGNYDYEVSGIGRTDASNLQNDSKGSAMLEISNPSDLGDNEYLIWGHDNGSFSYSATTDLPSGIQSKLNRVWRVNEVNLSGTAVDVGSIDLRWDLSNLNNVSESNLRLIVDTNNDGLFSDETPIAGATSLGSNIYKFSNISAITNNTRFTIATTNKNDTPLPVELIQFSVRATNENSALLTWMTASENDNEKFIVEKSFDGEKWIWMQDVKGAGNSSQIVSYEIYDMQTSEKLTYYRLTQKDYNGQLNYSKTIALSSHSNTTNTINLYPNPSNTMITIVGSHILYSEVELYDNYGKINISTCSLHEQTEQSLIIDISQLKEGVYYFKVNGSSCKFYKL